jgi:hypothetical protein
MAMKIYYTRFIMVTLLMMVGSLIIAQSAAKPIGPPIVKFKPPVVQSYLGTLTGKNAVASVEEGKNLIVLPLKIMDDKKLNYSVVSYQFAYKRIGAKEDEETGKITAQSDMVARQFNATPLPAIWQTNISETLHKGESLYFFDIIVLDKQARRFFAPELNITIQ